MTAFAEDVLAALGAPLAREVVKTRSQSGRNLSYIEGWHAIAEANRIFGFDGWSRETVMSECCYAGAYEKAIYENGRKTDKTTTSFRCSYRARVRVRVAGLVREGSGHGHGFADNPGEAHESAEKEAETDAMKRALMTFGNPFGLALYDKEQAEVAPAAAKSRPQSAAPPAARDPKRHADHERAVEIRGRLREAIENAAEPRVIDDILKVNDADLRFVWDFHEPTYKSLLALATTRKTELLASA